MEKIYRIMLVDRSEVVRSIVSRILQKEMQGVYIITCGSAEEALDYLHKEKFDLITTSLLLPGLDGLDLCYEIRQSNKQHLTPVIMVSSDADQGLLREGFSVGVTDYFNKSLGYKRLVEFIKDILQRHGSGLVGRVLYIEDCPNSTQTNQSGIADTILEKHGLSITHVTRVEKALDLLKNTKNLPDNTDQISLKQNEEYDLVLTDFFCGGQITGSGVADTSVADTSVTDTNLLYAIRTQLHYSRQEMPILVMITEDNKADLADIYHAGVNDFIIKPIIEEELIARVKSLLLVKHQYKVLKRYAKSVYRLETTDSLTGVHNKKYLLEEGSTFIAQHPSVCMMMIDIDFFDKLNELQGHIIGDRVLHLLGNFFISYFPKEMMVSRFAGKNFVVLMPDCTFDQGKAIAENLRRNLIALKPEGLSITASIGLASCDSVGESSLTSLISDADTALRAAQIQGHNRTCLCITHKNIITV